MKIYTGGTFDLFHHGHVCFLAKCKEMAGNGSVVVSLNSDKFVEFYKKKKPVCSYEERKSVLSACRYVDEVVMNIGEADGKPAILMTSPDIVVVGSDWARKDYYKQMMFDQDWLDSQGIGLAYIPYTRGISSTRIRGQL
jgi:glycerol-3-phosphate cytidylyltransferase